MADTSALARLRHGAVATVLVPLIEAGLVATCGVIEFETRMGYPDQRGVRPAARQPGAPH